MKLNYEADSRLNLLDDSLWLWLNLTEVVSFQ